MLQTTSVGDPTDSPPTSLSKNHSRQRFNPETTLVSPLQHQPGEFVGCAGDSTSHTEDATVAQTDQIIVFVSHGRGFTLFLHLPPVRVGLSHN
jgi:hypothetical protein